MKEKVTIVGAGLVGSLLSILMARRGHQVRVYERRPDMRKAGYVGGRSINLAMSYRGWKALELAGISDHFKEQAIPMPGRMIHSVTGELTYQPYGKEGEAIYSVSRGGLNLGLLELAGKFPNVELLFDHECAEYDLGSGRLTFRDHEGDLMEDDGDAVFATDGAYSAIRYSMMKRPGFNYSQKFLDHGYKELTIPPAADGGFQMEKNALHIWPRGNFMLIALPNPEGSFTCTLFVPMKGEISFEKLTNAAEVNAFFDKWFPDAKALISNLEGDFFTNPTSLLVTVHSYPWNYKNALLIGDAAHAIVPFYGQGMNAGFEDCTLLDAMMNENSGEDWVELFERFANSRKQDGDAIAELAQRNFIEMRDKVGDPMFLLRKKITAWLGEKFPHFIPVYTMVSFTSHPYSSALNEEDKQGQMFEEILALPGIAENWDREDVLAIFNRYYPQ